MVKILQKRVIMKLFVINNQVISFLVARILYLLDSNDS